MEQTISSGLIKRNKEDEAKVSEEDIQMLAESITEKGLLHKITVHEVNGKYHLITGLKRLLALESIGLTDISCVVMTGLTKDQMREIAIHENVKRANLEWPEEVELTSELHEIRQKQHGPAKGGRPADGEEKKGWGVRDTALELGVAMGAVSQDIQLAQAVKEDPSLRNIKDKQTAMRMVRVKAHRLREGVEQGAPDSTLSDFTNVCLLGSSAEILKSVPDRTFAGCITDPPWLKFRMEELKRDEETIPVFAEIYRTLRVDSFLVMFVGIDDYFSYSRRVLPELGFKVHPSPLIWHKPGVLTRTNAAWQFGRDIELILVAVKGKPALTSSTQVSSVFTHKPVGTKALIHPNEKPVKLIEAILDQIVYPNALIVDPFGGSGAIGHACWNKDVRFLLIERDRTSHFNINRRLEKVMKGAESRNNIDGN